MVDTINPQTGQSDSPLSGQSSVGQTAPQPLNDNYFAGFDKPEDVKVNLAAEGPSSFDYEKPKVDTVVTEAPAPVPQQMPSNTSQPVQSTPVSTPVQAAPAPAPAASAGHSTYTAKTVNFNFKALIFMLAAGLISVSIFATASYFIAKNISNQSIATENGKLTSLKSDLTNLQKSPDPLQLPASNVAPPSTQPTTPAPSTAPAVQTPPAQQTPIQVPAPSNPATSDQGTG